MHGVKAAEVLVAGGAGFIGSHLCDRLIADGFNVVCVDNFRTGRVENVRHLELDPRFRLIELDVIDELPHELRRTRFDRIYNLASAASPPHYQEDPEHTLLTNVMGTRNLLRLAEETGARFLLASTSEVYGEPERHPQDEDCHGRVSCTGPRACYDEGKRAAEALAFDFDRAGRADIRVVRIFNTYGPRMRPDDGRVISNFICQFLSGRPVTIYGDGSQTRSFCYVADLVDGLQKMMAFEGPQPGPVNLGNPQELSVLELAELIEKMVGSGSELIRSSLPVDDPTRRKPDIAKAGQLLGWKPDTSLKQGLAASIGYFREELAAAPATMTLEGELIAAE